MKERAVYFSLQKVRCYRFYPVTYTKIQIGDKWKDRPPNRIIFLSPFYSGIHDHIDIFEPSRIEAGSHEINQPELAVISDDQISQGQVHVGVNQSAIVRQWPLVHAQSGKRGLVHSIVEQPDELFRGFEWALDGSDGPENA